MRETIRSSLLPKPRLRRELRIRGLRPGSALRVNSGRLVDPLELAGARLARREGEFGTLEVLAPEVSFTLEVSP